MQYLLQTVLRYPPDPKLAILTGSDNVQPTVNLQRVQRPVHQLRSDLNRPHIPNERHPPFRRPLVHRDPSARARDGEQQELGRGEQERELCWVRGRNVVEVVVRRDEGRATGEKVARPSRERLTGCRRGLCTGFGREFGRSSSGCGSCWCCRDLSGWRRRQEGRRRCSGSHRRRCRGESRLRLDLVTSGGGRRLFDCGCCVRAG